MNRTALALLLALLGLPAAASAEGSPPDLLLVRSGQAPQDDQIEDALATAFQRLGRYRLWTAGDRPTLEALQGQEPGQEHPCASPQAPPCQAFLEQSQMDLVVLARLDRRQGTTHLSLTLHRQHQAQVVASVEDDLPPGKEPRRARKLARALHREALGSPDVRQLLASAPRDGALTPERQLRWTWLAGSLTVATALAATLVSLQAHSLENTLHDQLDEAQETPQPAVTITDRANQTDDHALASNVLWGVTGGLAITTVVVFLVEWCAPSLPDERRLTLHTNAERQGLSLSLEGRF